MISPLTLRFNTYFNMINVVNQVDKGQCLILDEKTLLISEEAYIDLMEDSVAQSTLVNCVTNGEDLLEQTLARNI